MAPSAMSPNAWMNASSAPARRWPRRDDLPPLPSISLGRAHLFPSARDPRSDEAPLRRRSVLGRSRAPSVSREQPQKNLLGEVRRPDRGFAEHRQARSSARLWAGILDPDTRAFFHERGGSQPLLHFGYEASRTGGVPRRLDGSEPTDAQAVIGSLVPGARRALCPDAVPSRFHRHFDAGEGRRHHSSTICRMWRPNWSEENESFRAARSASSSACIFGRLKTAAILAAASSSDAYTKRSPPTISI